MLLSYARDVSRIFQRLTSLVGRVYKGIQQLSWKPDHWALFTVAGYRYENVCSALSHVTLLAWLNAQSPTFTQNLAETPGAVILFDSELDILSICDPNTFLGMVLIACG